MLAWHDRALAMGDVDSEEEAEEAEEDVWDEATAARAQAEMLAARRGPGLWERYAARGHGPEALRAALSLPMPTSGSI